MSRDYTESNSVTCIHIASASIIIAVRGKPLTGCTRMMQVMDNMEASCIFYVKVGTVTHLERRKISLLTVDTSGIVTVSIQHDMILESFSCNIPGII